MYHKRFGSLRTCWRASTVAAIAFLLLAVHLGDSGAQTSRSIDLTITPDKVAEDGGAVEITVAAAVRGGRFSEDVTVTVRVSGGTATPGSGGTADYPTLAPFTITIPANRPFGTTTFWLTPINDRTIEEDETIILTPSAPGVTTVTSDTITITDDETLRAVVFTTDVTTVSEPVLGGTADVKVTITATLPPGQVAAGQSGSRGEDAVLRWTGTAKRGDRNNVRDYRTRGANQISIKNGERSGSLEIYIQTTDDNFWEGTETIVVSANLGNRGRPVIPARITLLDRDPKPTVKLTVGGGSVAEGATNQWLQILGTLEGGAVLEAPVEVKLNASELTNQTDVTFAPPVDEWSMTFAAVSKTAALPVTVTVPDDDIPELGEFMEVTGTATALGQSLTVQKTRIAFSASDRWLYSFEIDPERIVSSGGSTTFTVHARIWGGRIPPGGLTLTLRPCAGGISFPGAQCRQGGHLPADMQNAFSPASLTFRWTGDDIGKTCGGYTACQKTLTWTATTPELTRAQKVVFAAQFSGANVQLARYSNFLSSNVTFLSTAAPQVAEPLHLDRRLTPRPPAASPFLVGNQIGFRVGFSRKIKLTKAASLRMVLDSGPVKVPCQVDLPEYPHQIICTYNVARGQYDFDKKVQFSAGALDLGATLTNPDDADESWTSPTVPATAATISLSYEIHGGAHAFVATPTVQEGFREGAGEQTLKVLISDLAHIPAEEDIVIPISIRDGTTTASDWRLVQAGSVTIRKGATEGEGTAKIEALRDNINEDNETLLVGGGGGYVVKEGTLELIDAPELFLSATPNRIREGSTDVEVTLKVEIEATAAVFDTDHRVPILQRGEARQGKDYRWYVDRTDLRSTALVIQLPKGQRSAQIVRKLSVLEDHLVEGDEILRLIGAGGFLNVRPTQITLVDADTMPDVILSATPTSVTEGGGAQTVTVTARLAGNDTLPYAVDVTLGVSGDAVGWDPTTDGDARDYTPAWNPTTKKIAIPAGRTTGSAGVTLTVTPVDDSLAEGDEGITIEGAAKRQDTADRLTVQAAAVNLVDNDQRRVFVTPTALSIEGGLSKTYRVRLGSRPALGTNEKVRIEPRVPTGALLSVSPLDLEFDTTNWNTAQVVTVTAHPLAEEADVVIAHRVGGGDYVSVTADSVTVSLSEAPDLSLKLDDDSIAENGGVATVTAELGSAAAAPVTITVGAAPGETAAAADFALSDNKTLTIAAGTTTSTGTVTITANDNDFYLGAAKEVTVSGTVTGHAGVPNPPNLTLEIEEDDDPPSFSIADAAAEEDSGVTFTVTRGGATENAVSVKWTTALDTADDADAASTADFTAVTTAQTLSFAADDTEKTLTVAVTDDSLDEPDEETFLVVLSEPGEPAEIAEDEGEATGTITDNDDPPSFSISGGSAAEGDAVRFTVTRSGATENAVSVKVATAEDADEDAHAAETSDYTAITTAQTLSFASGDETKTVDVATTEDDIDEPDETFLAVLSVPALAADDPGTGVSIAEGGGSAKGTITDDDVRGITVSTATLTMAEADDSQTATTKEHEKTYTVVLTSEPEGGTVTVAV
ncbi:MAG: hypothetical protein OXF39_11315, partial [Nitrospira sp.]|nr:hypothetical protein [Nitrospira sp.]